ncbi:MAG: ChuX/HutX family heme-like substrate-binding protein [Flavobacteriales bacterium]
MSVIEKSLKEQWNELLAQQPKLRIRNAAEILGVTELELLVTTDYITPLQNNYKEILTAVGQLGTVMALTRNDSAVHEVKGEYDKPDFNPGPVGLFLGELIDLRIFFSTWKYAFAANEDGRKSLQFFDKYGRAVHKIYITEKSDENAYNQLVEQYRTYITGDYVIEPLPMPETFKNVSEIDVPAFKNDWLNMKDTHEFFGMLKKHGISRTDALSNAPECNYATQVGPETVKAMLEEASETKTPIMCFVGNPGMIQIYSGTVSRIVDMEEWINVLDPTFNLHLKKKDIAQTWVVRKPSEDGIVTSIEVFDAAGELIVQFFGKRKPGIPELTEWRSIVANVESSFKI